MQRFKNILYVGDPKSRGKAAFNRAAALARNNQGTLTAVAVVQRSKSNVDLLGPENAKAIEQAAIETRMKELAKLIAPLREQGIPAECTVLVGTPFYELIRKVLRDSHDLVVKEAHYKRGTTGVPFDPTELHLMRKCPCPVWINKPLRGKRFAKIMAAVDPDPSDAVQFKLTTKIMDLASNVARWDQSELHVVHAWDIYGEGLLSTVLGMKQRDVARIVEGARNRATDELERLISAYRDREVVIKTHVLKGEPGKIIPAFAKQSQVGLIVMGTVARTGIAGILMGNTAEAVLDQVDCSYLTVKPDGFECPITL